MSKFLNECRCSAEELSYIGIDECQEGITCNKCPLYDPIHGCLSDLMSHIANNWGRL